MSFLNVSREAETNTILQTRRKTQTSQSYGFLTNFAWSRNPYNSQDMRKVNSQCKGKNMEKHKHSKVKGFLHILGETEIHAILKPWDEWIPILWNKYGKAQAISKFWSSSQILS